MVHRFGQIRLAPLAVYDCARMAALMNRHYARQRPEAYFRWQYFDCPLPVVSVGAFRGQQLVAIFGLQRKQLSDGQTIDQVIDILIDADFRGQGLFFPMWQRACANLASDGAQMVLANPSGRDACLKWLGYEVVCQIDSLTLTVNNLAQAILPLDSACAEPLRLTMDRALFDWRFTHHPLFRYRVLGDFQSGLLVVKIFGQGSDRQGDIVYYQGKPDPSLWRHACQSLFSEGVTQVNCWATAGTAERHNLLSLGFECQPQARFLCVKAQDPLLREAGRWNVVQADTEHF